MMVSFLELLDKIFDWKIGKYYEMNNLNLQRKYFFSWWRNVKFYFIIKSKFMQIQCKLFLKHKQIILFNQMKIESLLQ
jgi:hypothetical protein